MSADDRPFSDMARCPTGVRYAQQRTSLRVLSIPRYPNIGTAALTLNQRSQARTLELRESLDVAKLGVAQGAQRHAVEIDETQPAAARDEIRR